MSKSERLTVGEKKQLQAKKKLRQTIISAVVLVVIVALVIGFVVVERHTGLLLHTTTAASTANQTLNKAMMTYYFNDYFTDYVTERLYYIQNGYLELDLETSLKAQTYDGINTWYSYFADKAAENIRRDLLLAEAAGAGGIALTDEEKQTIAAQAAAINPASYGRGVRAEDILRCMELQALAEKYLAATEDALYGGEADWEAAYHENVDAYATVDYKAVDMAVSITSQAAQEAYDKLLDKALSSHEPAVFDETVKQIMISYAGMTEAQAAAQVADNTQYSQTLMADNAVYAWMFAEDRKLYDTYLEETTSSCKLYMVTRLAGRDTSPTVNYRNILLTGETVDAARVAAETLLKQWQDGEATPESFSLLAAQHSKDTVSRQTNGIYRNVFYGRMDSEVNDWLFAAERKAGDVAIVETAQGAQILYYEGEGLARWQLRIRNDMYEQRYEKLLADLEKQYAYALLESVLDDIRARIAA